MSTEEVDIFLKRVSVDQRAAELPAVKVGGFKKKSAARLAQASRVRTGPSGRIADQTNHLSVYEAKWGYFKVP